jgi:hypothetical protein
VTRAPLGRARRSAVRPGSHSSCSPRSAVSRSNSRLNSGRPQYRHRRGPSLTSRRDLPPRMAAVVLGHRYSSSSGPAGRCGNRSAGPGSSRRSQGRRRPSPLGSHRSHRARLVRGRRTVAVPAPARRLLAATSAAGAVDLQRTEQHGCACSAAVCTSWRVVIRCSRASDRRVESSGARTRRLGAVPVPLLPME